VCLAKLLRIRDHEPRPTRDQHALVADLAAALAPTGPYKGLNVYSSTVIRRQTVSRRDVQVGHEYGYTVVLRNQSNEPGSIRLKAQQGGRAAASVRYFLDGVEVTAAITGTGSQTAVLAPWAAKSLLVTIKPLAPRVAGSAVKVDIRGSPVSTPAAVDVVRLKARL